jgi:hypothetical protein
MIFALDQMLAANADSGSDFFGALDPSRIGMSGHSFGGLTTFLVTNMDSAHQGRRADGARDARGPTACCTCRRC